MNLQHVIARRFAPVSQSYDWRDAALYALGLGTGDDPLDEDELPYVYEGRAQLVTPSMCVTLGWPPLWIAEPETGIAWTQALHGEERFRLHRPLPVRGSVRADHSVHAIITRGRDAAPCSISTRSFTIRRAANGWRACAPRNSCAGTAAAATTARRRRPWPRSPPMHPRPPASTTARRGKRLCCIGWSAATTCRSTPIR